MMNYDRYHKMRPHTYHPTFLLSNSKPAFRQEHRGVSHSNYVMKWGFTRRNGPPEHQARTHSDVTGHLAHGRPWLSRQVYRLTLELLAVLPSFLHDTPFDPRWAFSEVSTQPGDLHSSLVPCEHLLYLKSGVSTQPGELQTARVVGHLKRLQGAGKGSAKAICGMDRHGSRVHFTTWRGTCVVRTCRNVSAGVHGN